MVEWCGNAHIILEKGNETYSLCYFKKEVKIYTAYFMLCYYFGLHDEFDNKNIERKGICPEN